MQALILSAGKGTRLYPLTKNIPKIMVEIRGKPLLEHHIKLLKKYVISEIFINLFTLPHVIKNYFGNGKKYGVKIKYAVEPKLLGTAGALHNFKKELKNNFFVLYGDVFMQVDLLNMLNFHKIKKSLFTLAVHKARHPKDSDLVETNNNGGVVRWLNTPHGKSSGMSNAGLYLINKQVLRYLPDKIPLDFAGDFIPLLLKKIPLYAYYSEELMMDIGTPERYNNLLKTLIIKRVSKRKGS